MAVLVRSHGLLRALLSVCFAAAASLVSAQTPLSEADYFDTLPLVLTVSRLDQPLADTPGAVTVIDRETVRRLGARDVTDVLRLVPGYLVSGYNGAHPTAAYHAPLDDFGTRNLVLVDGRSVYSSFYLGGTHRGMAALMVEDIERIEVLRGSNAAAYGANAVFGVINIITRHADDTQGLGLVANAGGVGVRDVYTRLGWGGQGQSWRVSVGRTQDTGYGNAFDDRRTDRVHLRGDIQIDPQTTLLWQAGTSDARLGDGFSYQVGNPTRTVRWQSHYLRGQWKRQWTGGESLTLDVGLDDENTIDRAPYTPIPGVVLDQGGQGRRWNAEAQYRFNVGDRVRSLWGVGLKRDEAVSKPLYAQDTALVTQELRTFASVEWQAAAATLVNGSVLAANNSRVGSYVTPRLWVNQHVTPDHTLRVGWTRSLRTPSLFELAADVRYYNTAGVLLAQTWDASGRVQPERLRSVELGYFGHFRDHRLTVDVRLYQEKLDGVIDVPFPNPVPRDYGNLRGLSTHGLEQQWRWSPTENTSFWWAHNLMRYRWSDPGYTRNTAPKGLSSLAWFQTWSHGWDTTLTWYNQGPMTWRGADNTTPTDDRVDVRVARSWRWGENKAELALTVQALNGKSLVFTPTTGFVQERKAWLSLRLEH